MAAFPTRETWPGLNHGAIWGVNWQAQALSAACPVRDWPCAVCVPELLKELYLFQRVSESKLPPTGSLPSGRVRKLEIQPVCVCVCV